MKDKRQEYKVQELVDLDIIEKPLDGNHGEIHPKGEDFISFGIPFIMSSDINQSLIDFKSCKFISLNQAKKLKKGFAKEGDVLLTHKASIGRTAVVPRNSFQYILLTPQVTYYRVKDHEKLNNLYLKYYFDTKSFQSVLAAYSGAGSTRAYIGITEQLNLPVKLPDIFTQKKIASVLSALDSKIELNNRINAELEAMAKTLYDYWFVQFDFPDKNGKPYKTSGGKMVWNEVLKKEIPEGWYKGNFTNYCSSNGGFAFKSTWWTDNGVAVAKIKDIQENYILDTSNLARVDISDKEIDDKFLTKAGDILIAMTGATVGKYAIVPITDYPIYVNQRVGYFNLGSEPTKKLPFLINSMNQSYFRNAIFTLANGAAQPNISNEQINNIQLLIPENKLIETYNEMCQPYYKKILNNQLENQKLTELRDWLLPMLMNGQVKVE